MQQRDDRSIGELFAELTRETVTLVRKEIQPAKAEMTQKASRIGKNVGFLVAGGVAAQLLGGHTLLALSALIVGLVIIAIGTFLALKGINILRNESPAPRETVETLKEIGNG